MTRWISLAAFAVVALMGARDGAADTDLAVLAEPRTHAIMRHALAPGTSDPAGFALGDCSTQRNLDARGRAQAAATGAALRAAGVRFDRVWTSRWCRSRDTAVLMELGEVEEVPPLDSFFEDRARRRPQTDALMARLLDLPPDETVLMVSHQVNISALAGGGTSSGEIVLFSIDADGSVRRRGRFLVPVP